ncbi:probable dolichyl pyrophosphate Glc1Man9GlcNAc2 alpha-1,3-glucosyltransferase [Amphibalanus amphitrite]|uniref:probable dolichyl pyrophosphate Glc1Man9GlcNAc2 alpha-1,3-glucosyltransferase n=1 Tax=Amphibalanus amphitrite TaxID=1232801 RepID=UPI001C926B50|nr:probable dolichyl pyrophosphate Glc1Man9GlcNAc2 alpha-1,3-glucosyltransferase [Amphibalanus amphitrite]XP_043226820.1 probable dolichyl pyrophosphate Glc1Man9GlcNAc2 alpha-1,3-glucosyltransferase [Amphibalanus amphitrite]XP_043226821.1 probable dolichyl pyrophosphate Glc1Man9GlcNAc2 alpha-1,3-glucosyltransferase [Amphibalanus amphitrite]XP_043226822.1 probable dolichyl pyrophosphate Glc1Man9GlcNAc2 alpha-1,3-glucosyltransferase [Amphibalanus amphitrite]XP_043226823.1 probable dolichyl pyroph
MDSIYEVFILTSCLKLLLIPAYRSTDFEVHRNWLAITHSLPLEQWYTESTSEWTLDYPPLFAWFEYCLSQLAAFFDPRMLEVQNLNYASPATILFQRLTVIASDFVLLVGVKKCADTVPGQGTYLTSPRVRLAALTLGSAGLIMVDHIHFQYNGLLIGLLLISYAHMTQGRFLKSAFFFTVLLNMKHIFLYLAPAYFVFLLRNYCVTIPAGGWLPRPQLANTAKLGLVVLGVFGLSLAPFAALGQLPQLVSRLFPFKRGLCHAYWAPNLWVFYNLADKLAVFGARRLGVSVPGSAAASMTGGLVQDVEHALLPAVRPAATFALSAAAMLPALVTLWRRPADAAAFLRALVQCALCSFLLGWHVHEKAVLLAVVPLAVLALRSGPEARLYLLLSAAAHVSLGPLLFGGREAPARLLLAGLHAGYAAQALPAAAGPPSRAYTGYLAGLAAVAVYDVIGHRALGLDGRWPFLPLLVTSLYCAVGVVCCWLALYWHMLFRVEGGQKIKVR